MWCRERRGVCGPVRGPGADPGPQPERRWQDEWPALRAEVRWRQGDTATIDEDWVRTNQDASTWLSGCAGAVANLEARGWSRPDAEAYLALAPQSNTLGLSMRNHSTQFAASVYALSAQQRKLSVLSFAFCETKRSGFQVQGIPQEEHGEFLIIIVNILH